jgi:hypothetical protein
MIVNAAWWKHQRHGGSIGGIVEASEAWWKNQSRVEELEAGWKN